MNLARAIDASVVEPLAQPLRDRLAVGLAPKLRPVFDDIHDEIAAYAGPALASATAAEHADAVQGYCNAQKGAIERFQQAQRDFQTRIANAGDEAEEFAAIIDFARELGADRRQLQSDRKALNAYFDTDAVTERFHKRVGERERALAHGVTCLGRISRDAIKDDPMFVHSAFFANLLENVLASMRGWPGDPRIRAAAHHCLASIAGQIDQWPFGAWFEAVLSATRRVCLDEQEDVWVQSAALDALLVLSPESLASAIASRLSEPLETMSRVVADKDLFLRRHFVRIVSANMQEGAKYTALIEQLSRDESGAVRQSVVGVLPDVPEVMAQNLAKRFRQDADPQVRAMLFADPVRMVAALGSQAYAAHLRYVLGRDTDEFVLRIALDAAAKVATISEFAAIGRIQAAIALLREREIAPKIRRWADEAFERVWLAGNADAREIARELLAVTHDQAEAEIRAVPAMGPWLDADPVMVGRTMAVLAQNDFGLSLRTGLKPRVQRGEWIKRRLWRILFEGRHSATDKRQAFLHTTGRNYYGTMLAPSARMSELAPTKVPGEPLMESSEGGWRNYLPLVDQILAASDHGKKLEIFTSAGVTTVTPPRGFWRRLRLFWTISRDFAALADQRNRRPQDYLQQLRAQGFAVEFARYDDACGENLSVSLHFASVEADA